MSWEKIEDHLFCRYCVEGEDKELQRLMDKHDEEVRKETILAFLSKVKKHQYPVSDRINSTDYGMFTIGLEQIARELINNDKTEESRLNPLCPEKQNNQTIVKQFTCAKEMLDYILEGHDLYNPIIERYVFAYNDRNAICVYTGIDSFLAENLQKNVEAGEAEYWSELLSQTGGMIFEEANPFKNNPFKNINWCETYYKETGWVDTSDYIKYLEFEEEFELE